MTLPAFNRRVVAALTCALVWATDLAVTHARASQRPAASAARRSARPAGPALAQHRTAPGRPRDGHRGRPHAAVHVLHRARPAAACGRRTDCGVALDPGGRRPDRDGLDRRHRGLRQPTRTSCTSAPAARPSAATSSSAAASTSRPTRAGRGTFVGLRDAGQIGSLAVHPTNPDVVWVAALGSPFGPNAERGIFKTTDGGKTVGARCSSSTTETGARVVADELVEPGRAVRRACTAASARAGTSSAAGPRAKAASTSRPTAARRGRSCRRACRRR